MVKTLRLKCGGDFKTEILPILIKKIVVYHHESSYFGVFIQPLSLLCFGSVSIVHRKQGHLESPRVKSLPLAGLRGER